MLTFFRKIRKSLLGSGQAQKYMLYAIGEIALVVIGILIALQINNWNEWRKERELEKIILTDLAQDIEENIEQLTSSIQKLEQWNISGNIILKAFENKPAYSDTLDRHFSQARGRGLFEVNLTIESFKVFENQGFGIVQNQDLKKGIIFLFTNVYNYLPVIANMIEGFIPEDFNIWYQHFYGIQHSPRLIKPFNYEELIRTNEIYARYKNIHYVRISIIQNLNNCIDESRRILQLINKELKIIA